MPKIENGESSGDVLMSLLTRRRFLSTLLRSATVGSLAPSLFGCFARDQILLTEAAELSRDTVLKDIDYVYKLLDADHVGIATDLFGLDDRTAIPTHKEFALIPAALLKRGYAETDVVKIVGGNFMRVFREVSASAG